jgi:hypothetical protein
MKRRTFMDKALTVAGSAALVLVLAGCEREEGPMEETGGAIDRGATTLGEETRDAGQAIERGTEETIQEGGQALEQTGEAVTPPERNY